MRLVPAMPSQSGIVKTGGKMGMHADKTDCQQYRREGLLCTSSLIESHIKKFNAHLKESETTARLSATTLPTAPAASSAGGQAERSRPLK